ncbi:MAG: DUF2007 domain-containing protein [Muribaculum sp.]|nr:DUF2007 domain-containing protein [Muribaculaceae bacterium]MCM1080140.1 DUF2007 domain-containing protein [Muribaculum sp.]
MHQHDNSNPIVLLAAFNSQSEAYVVKDMLEANGIVCALNDGNMSTIYGGVAFPTRLFVLRSQADLARELMREHNDMP